MVYKVGCFSDLMSYNGDGAYSSLFTTLKKQQNHIKKSNENLSTHSRSNNDVNKLETDKHAMFFGISPKKFKLNYKKKEHDLAQKSTDDMDQIYLTPSRKYQMKAEESNRIKKTLCIDADKRTIFVGNLPLETNKKSLKLLFSSYGNIETIRFRCAARPDAKTTKKVAVITKRFHNNRHNINAYVRFANEDSVQCCINALNGTVFNNHTIRVDRCYHDDSRDLRCSVFIGNLSYDLEENAVYAHFKECGRIIGVRLVRDSSTGVGKGFGYVNFEASSSVQLALELNGSLLAERKIRVSRCVAKSLKMKAILPKVSNEKPKLLKKKKKMREPQQVSSSFQGEMAEGGNKNRRKVKPNRDLLKKKRIAKRLESCIK